MLLGLTLITLIIFIINLINELKESSLDQISLIMLTGSLLIIFIPLNYYLIRSFLEDFKLGFFVLV